MEQNAATEAVRQYLMFIHDPASLVDENRLREIDERMAQTTDPVQRVLLRDERYAAEAPDGRSVEEAFVQHARDWVTANNVSARALEAEGVPAAVLRRAGIQTSNGKRTRTSTSAPRQRQVRVSADQIKAAIPATPFTVRSIADATGATTGTVRKVITRLEEEGSVREIGMTSEGSGRPSKQYERVAEVSIEQAPVPATA